MHGAVLESFRMSNPLWYVTQPPLDGVDQNGATVPGSIDAVTLELSADAAAQPATEGFSPSLELLRLVRDAGTQLYEHPVVIAENDSHELWPNSSGSVAIPVLGKLLSGQHGGNGFSYLPTQVQMLGSADVPVCNNTPFVHYNGKFGTDPAAIALHKTWYYPHGRGNEPFPLTNTKFTDQDPYVTLGTLEWPPKHDYDGSQVVGFVSKAGAQANSVVGVTGAKLNDASYPFSNIPTAVSFVPAGGTVMLVPDTYPGPMIISHPVKLAVTAGNAILGGHNRILPLQSPKKVNVCGVPISE
jgi:hypothetical protein